MKNTTEKLKLNLGCDRDIREGYVNIDQQKFGSPLGDLITIMDVRDLQFPDNFVDEIYAECILEHLSYFEIQETIWNWWRVLKVGGLLTIVVPDFDIIAQQWLDGQLSREILHREVFCSIQNSNNQMPHLCTFDKKYLRELLENEGFRIDSMENIGTEIKAITTKFQ